MHTSTEDDAGQRSIVARLRESRIRTRAQRGFEETSLEAAAAAADSAAVDTSLLKSAASVLTAPCDDAFGWTVWPSSDARQHGVRYKDSWSAFVGLLARCPQVDVKSSLPGWSPGWFAANRRNASGVLVSTAVVLDYDASEINTPMSEAFEAFEGIRSFAHTTHSHGRDGKHRFRVVLPTCRPMTADEYRRVLSCTLVLVEAIGHRPGRVENDPARFWFQPGHPLGSDGFDLWARGGLVLDVDGCVQRWNEIAHSRAFSHLPTARTAAEIEAAQVVPPHALAHMTGAPDEAIIRRAIGLLAKIPDAVSGSKGSVHTMDAAMVLVRGFCLSDEVALELLEQEFNPRCAPAWTTAELKHKIKSARQRGRKAWGYLLDDRPRCVRLPHLYPQASSNPSLTPQGLVRAGSGER